MKTQQNYRLLLPFILIVCFQLFITGTVLAKNSVNLLSGFSFSWKELPHRINKIGIQNDSCFFTGGSWSDGDKLYCFVINRHLESNESSFIHWSYFTTINGSLKEERDKTYTHKIAEKYEDIVVNLEGKDINKYENITVLLNGFVFDVENPRPGFTVKSIAAKIVEYKRVGNLLTIKFYSKLMAGIVPDRYQNLTKYIVTTKIDFVLIGFNDGITKEFSVTEIGINSSKPKSFTDGNYHKIDYDSEYSENILGMAGFDITLDPKNVGHIPKLHQGFYLREFSLFFDDAHNDEGNNFNLYFFGEFSNRSQNMYKTTSTIRTDFTLIQLNDPTLKKM